MVFARRAVTDVVEAQSVRPPPGCLPTVIERHSFGRAHALRPYHQTIAIVNEYYMHSRLPLPVDFLGTCHGKSRSG